MELVAREGQLDDSYAQPFGMRTVEGRGTELLINGEPFYFTGFGKHEDSPVQEIGRGRSHRAPPAHPRTQLRRKGPQRRPTTTYSSSTERETSTRRPCPERWRRCSPKMQSSRKLQAGLHQYEKGVAWSRTSASCGRRAAAAPFTPTVGHPEGHCPPCKPSSTPRRAQPKCLLNSVYVIWRTDRSLLL
ncbi:hypothetical protein [Streptomyces sp. V4I8]|uniref:hypothetical protein n=1 Tax=Streptomyces sp. V4I8 TaxID=3156469 RepID=UPI0035197E1C